MRTACVVTWSSKHEIKFWSKTLLFYTLRWFQNSRFPLDGLAVEASWTPRNPIFCPGRRVWLSLGVEVQFLFFSDTSIHIFSILGQNMTCIVNYSICFCEGHSSWNIFICRLAITVQNCNISWGLFTLEMRNSELVNCTCMMADYVFLWAVFSDKRVLL